MSNAIELVHALLMVAWVASFPFLFWHGRPGLSQLAAIYTVLFIVVNRVSHLVLGECVLTRMARWAGGAWDSRWFTIKLTRFIFNFIPSNKQVAHVEQAFIFVAAIGVLVTVGARRKR